MIRFNKTASLAAILAMTVSGGALAQSVGAGVGTGAGASVGAGDAGASVGASADASGSATSGSGADAASGNAGGNASAQTKVAGDMGGMSEEMNYGRIISSLKTGANAKADIAGIKADTKVNTVTLSEVKGEAEDNAEALDNALAEAETELTDMHSMISANADFNAMLEAQGYTSDDVIGVYQSADGSYSVLVDDRS